MPDVSADEGAEHRIRQERRQPAGAEREVEERDLWNDGGVCGDELREYGREEQHGIHVAHAHEKAVAEERTALLGGTDGVGKRSTGRSCPEAEECLGSEPGKIGDAEPSEHRQYPGL